uniref:Non-haem dioxygenase N-terminal domain-containing protein n=1 Tax=Leersia perrieri TaxID=77586 RepID=A0A0D9VVT3_9ORYZ
MEPSVKTSVNCREVITEAAAAALAKSNLIPERYLRPDEVQAGTIIANDSDDDAHELPVVDMGRLLDPGLSEMEVSKLGSACRHWGFFQLVNNGVHEQVVSEMRDSIVKFFSLPLKSKKTVEIQENGYEGWASANTHRSYMQFVSDFDQLMSDRWWKTTHHLVFDVYVEPHRAHRVEFVDTFSRDSEELVESQPPRASPAQLAYYGAYEDVPWICFVVSLVEAHLISSSRHHVEDRCPTIFQAHPSSHVSLTWGEQATVGLLASPAWGALLTVGLLLTYNISQKNLNFSGSSTGKLDWSENLLLLTQRTQDRTLQLWPTNPSPFRYEHTCINNPLFVSVPLS